MEGIRTAENRVVNVTE